MGWVTLPRPRPMFGPYWGISSGSTMSGSTMNSSTTGFAFSVLPWESGTISKVAIAMNTRTGTPPTYRAGITTIDSNRRPTLTWAGATGNGYYDFTPPAAATWNSTVQEFTLNETVDVTAATAFGLAVYYQTGTVNGSNNMSMYFGTQYAGANGPQPLAYSTTTGTFSSFTAANPVFGYYMNSKWYGMPLISVDTTTTGDTSGNKSALGFQFPSTLFSAIKVVGLQFGGLATNTTTGPPTFTLSCETDTTVNASKQYTRGAAWSSTDEFNLFLGSEVELAADTWHRMALVCDANTSNWRVAMHKLLFSNSTHAESQPDGTIRRFESYSGGAWTTQAECCPVAAPIVSAVNIPSGSSSFLRGILTGGRL